MEAMSKVWVMLLLVAYVDDVLLASENEKVQKAVEEAIGQGGSGESDRFNPNS